MAIRQIEPTTQKLYIPMVQKLNERMASGTVYNKFIYMADTRWGDPKNDPAAFERILNHAAMQNPLFILHGGDLVVKASVANYSSFRTVCLNFTARTGIPIIPTIGNHEYYGVLQGQAVPLYEQEIGPVNYLLEIPKGITDTVSIVGWDDSEPDAHKASIPDPTCKKFVNVNYTKFEFSNTELNTDLTKNIDNAQGKHIAISMHIPPRLSGLVQAMNLKVAQKSPNCINPSPRLAERQKYYRDLWTLQPSTNASFLNLIKARPRVEMVACGHIHTYYTEDIIRTGMANTDMVISGCAGVYDAGSFPGFPLPSKYNYVIIEFQNNVLRHRFVPVF